MHEEHLRELLVKQQEINRQLDLDKGDTQAVAGDVPQDDQVTDSFVDRIAARRTGRGQVNDLEGVA